MAPHTIPYRASDRVDNGPRIPRASGSIASSGSRTSSSTSSDVTEARSESLRPTSLVENPGESVGTMNPRIPSSVCAHTMATSAIPPFVIHIFDPESTQSEPSRLAAVRIPPGSLPASGSVRPKHPTTSPAAMRGSHSFFCSSLPNLQMGHMARDPWTEMKERNPASPASSSMQASPYWTALAPPHP